MAKRNAIIKGLQRSGTNVLTAVLEQNFKVECHWRFNEYGGKHMPFTGGPKNAPVFISLKNPYAWMHSIYRHSKKAGRSRYSQAKDFSTFLRQELLMPTPVGMESFWRPATCWMDMNLSWSRIESRKVVLVQVEKWLNRTESHNWITVISKWLPRKSKKPIIPKKVPVNRNFDPTIYTQKRWLEAYSLEDIKYVNRILVPEVVERFGYKCESR